MRKNMYRGIGGIILCAVFWGCISGAACAAQIRSDADMVMLAEADGAKLLSGEGLIQTEGMQKAGETAGAGLVPEVIEATGEAGEPEGGGTTGKPGAVEGGGATGKPEGPEGGGVTGKPEGPEGGGVTGKPEGPEGGGAAGKPEGPEGGGAAGKPGEPEGAGATGEVGAAGENGELKETEGAEESSEPEENPEKPTEAEVAGETKEPEKNGTSEKNGEAEEVENTERIPEISGILNMAKPVPPGAGAPDSAAVLSLARSSIGILAANPQSGQQNIYEYTGGKAEFTVPVTGIYEIECRGAQGGTAGGDAGRTNQYGSGSESITIFIPAKGDAVSSRVLLEKGTVLRIDVGSIGGNGWASDMYSGSGGSGGYPDGRAGMYTDHWGGCKNEYDGPAHCAWAGTGGSGGSTCVEYKGSKIISAQGGRGGSVVMSTCNKPNKTVDGAAGGGYSALTDTGGILWRRGELERTEQNVNPGNGRAIITLRMACVSFDLQASPDDWTNKDVTISAVIRNPGEGLPADYIAWETDESGADVWTSGLSYQVSENGAYTCKVRDVLGNVVTQEITISNIDRLLPEGEITADNTEWTRSDVTLEIIADDAEETAAYGKSGLQKAPFSWQEDETGQPVWTAKASHTVSQNGTYLCRVRDNAGNITECTFVVKNIDRRNPETVMLPSVTKWTNQDVVITALAEDTESTEYGSSGIQEAGYAWGVVKADGEIIWMQESPEETTGEETQEEGEGQEGRGMQESGNPVWTAEESLMVSQNGTYLCRTRDRAGNETETRIQIRNIDRLPPEAVVKAEPIKNTGHTALGISGRDAEATTQYGQSGIKDYCWETPDGKKGVFRTEDLCIASQNGTYVCLVRDHAGNVTRVSYQVSGIREPKGPDDEAQKPDSGNKAKPGPAVPVPSVPDQTGTDTNGNADISGADVDPALLLGRLKGLFQAKAVEPEPVKKAAAAVASAAITVQKSEDSKEEGERWRRNHVPEKSNRTGEKEEEGKNRNIRAVHLLHDRDVPHYLAKVMGSALGGILLYLILFYSLRTADILAMDGDGEYVLIGRRRISKRRDVFQIRIDHRLYARAETEAFEIRPGNRFIRRNKGEWLLVCYEDQKMPLLIEEEMRITIPGKRRRDVNLHGKTEKWAAQEENG